MSSSSSARTSAARAARAARSVPGHHHNLRPRPVTRAAAPTPGRRAATALARARARARRAAAAAAAAVANPHLGRPCSKCHKPQPWTEYVHKKDPSKRTQQCRTCREISNRSHAKKTALQ
ncbi:hypothetical protein N7540_004664 [Penicillium herquei]|nr:hypothetical protein N7540_004664 [Penicillium herquei]